MIGEPNFFARVRELPRLGVGISTEFGAGLAGLDLHELVARHGDLVHFLEIGADLARGIDDDARSWVAAGRAATYHFLDVNLEQAEDLDETWIAATTELARAVGAAWLCGDAGIWHIGPRDRGHGTLLPPILEPESARDMAANIRAMRAACGFEVLPENPPAQVYVGTMSLLDYFRMVMEEADCGMLLDVAHLAIYQNATGRDALADIDDALCERVVEMHVAGGSRFSHGGRTFIADDHGLAILDETWRIYDHVRERAPNLKAVVLEAERNSVAGVVPVFARLNETFPFENGLR